MILQLGGVNCQVSVVKIFIVQVAPLQPYGKWGSPCQNVSEDVCKAGFARQVSVVHDAEKTANATIKMASVLSISRLVSTHPRWIEINYELFMGAGFDCMYLTDPDAFSERRKIGDALSIIDKYNKKGFPTVASNVADSELSWRGFLKYYTGSNPIPGVKLGILVTWPEQFWYPTISISNVVGYSKYLKYVLGITHIVVHCPHKITKSEALLYVEGGIVDVIAYVDAVVSSDPKPAVVETILINKRTVFVIQISALEYRVDDISLTFDGTTLIAVTPVALPTVDIPEHLLNSYYHMHSSIIQNYISDSAKQDKVFCDSVTAMPDGNVLTDGVFNSPCLYKECELGALLTAAMTIPREVDISLTNGGSAKRGWKAGPVRGSQLSAAFPYKNTLCYFNVSAAEIHRILEASVMFVGTDGQLNSSAEIPGRFLQITGLRYSFNPSLEAGKRITSILYQNKPGNWSDIDMQRQYRIVTNSYLCHGGDGYDFKTHSGELEITQTDQYGTVLSYLRENSPYTPGIQNSITTTFNLVYKQYAKGASDCTDEERWDLEWETCIRCMQGLFHPVSGAMPCVPRRPPPPSRESPIKYVVPPVVGIILITVVIVYFLYKKEKNRIRDMTKFAPTHGPIAVVFTDIQSSSSLWGLYPEEMTEALNLHHKIFRRLINKHRGYEVKTIGDAFMIAFSSAIDAVEFSCDLQVELYDETWPNPLLEHESCETISSLFHGLRVRSGVHYGDCVVKTTPQGGYDYEGNIINSCARVTDAGAGGQALLTEAAYGSAEDYLAEINHNVDCKYLGAFKFKGISDPIGCVQILPERFANRNFAELRNCTRFEPPQPDVETGNTSENMSHKDSMTIVQERGELIDATQTLRRFFGPEGLSVSQASDMIMVPVQDNIILDLKLISAFFKVLLENKDISNKNRIIKDSDTIKSGSALHSSVDGSNDIVKWSVFNKLLLKLPTQAVVSMARHSELMKGGKLAW